MNQEIIDLATYLTSSDRPIRLEAEGKRERLQRFIAEYNNITGIDIDSHTDGIVLLQDDADKRGPELRVYFSDITNFPRKYSSYLRSNTIPENNYRHFVKRINNNNLINSIIKSGLRIGDT